MRHRGYTLLEVLVVVVILGVMSGFIMLSLRGNSEAERLADAADRFAALLQIQCEEALLGQRATRVRVDDRGYRFELSTRSGWQSHDKEVFRERRWPLQVALQLDVDGRGGDDAIDCLPTGELTPFELSLRSPGGSTSAVRVTAGGVIERHGSRE